MLDIVFEPFFYDYMIRAMWVSGLIGASCGFLSAYLMLRGWSLIGDALAHAVVPGVAIAYLLAMPYAAGAFISGILAALGMALVKNVSQLREDAIIGLVFTAFFASGLLLVSLRPAAVNLTAVLLGNILAINDADVIQVTLITVITLALLCVFWKDLMLIFFDESYARSIGLPVFWLKIMFFTVLSACVVAALQSVGACLVIAVVVTPGACAYLLTDRFGVLICLSAGIGALSSMIGVYISYFLDGATGGVIVCLQTLLFLTLFLAAPRHGMLATRRARAFKINAKVDL